MKTSVQVRVLTALLMLSPILSALGASASSELTPRLQRMTSVADGLHLWYEIKSDPEDPGKLIICGTKWDGLANTPFGFVYFSGDRGQTWRNVLEDRNSPWVSEHSCAFGPQHRAYFISEAAREVEGGTSPKLGTTRLYFSIDGGEHWVETLKTGWADYSTSATSLSSARLYTFFHAGRIAPDEAHQKGNDLGLLVFSPDGHSVMGPYFSAGTRDHGYTGIYPSNALSLRSGAVIALYYATRQTPNGPEIELGTMRANESLEPDLAQTVIAHPQIDVAGTCLNFDNGSLAYDAENDRLFVIYTDGCHGESHLMLATSQDEGKTWSNGVAISMPKNLNGTIYSPSVVVVSERVLGLLWEDKPCSPRWFFSYIENGAFVDPPLTLLGGSDKPEISNDSLWTVISQPNHIQGADPNSPPERAITVDVRVMVNALWRTDGVLLSNGRILAIWSSGTAEGMRLYSGLIDMTGSKLSSVSANESGPYDVTGDTSLVYGGDRNDAGQYYDAASRTLDICGSLRNRGRRAIKSPIEIRVESLHSPWGPVSVVNAANALKGTGAVWDVSGFLTGDRIPAGTTSNPFCMSFHFGAIPPNLPPVHLDLLSFRVKVFARYAGNRDISAEQVQLGK